MQFEEASSSIADLPEEVLVAVVDALTRRAHGNAGDVCRLMLVCISVQSELSVSLHLKIHGL